MLLVKLLSLQNLLKLKLELQCGETTTAYKPCQLQNLQNHARHQQSTKPGLKFREQVKLKVGQVNIR